MECGNLARKRRKRVVKSTWGFKGYNAVAGKPAAYKRPLSYVARPNVYSRAPTVFVPVRPEAVRHNVVVPSGRVPVGRHNGLSLGGKISHPKSGAGDAIRREAQPPKRGTSQVAVKSREPAKQSLKTRDRVTCKPRPNSKEARKGSGGSREFVPWC